METGELERTGQHLARAEEELTAELPQSDMMATVLRRKAQLCNARTQNVEARILAVSCLAMCKATTNDYDRGVALRVLGQAWGAEGCPAKARACFDASLQTLSRSQAGYELMKTLIAYGNFLPSDLREPS